MKIRLTFMDFQILPGNVAAYCKWGGNLYCT